MPSIALQELREAWEDGQERGLVTGVRSGLVGASRSMRTRYLLKHQFVVEVGRTCVREHQRSLGGE